MALHLNLYHEIHRQAERERRDPFKIAGLVAILIVILMTGWYLYRSGSVSHLQAQGRATEVDWGRISPELKRVEENRDKVLRQQKANRLLVERIQNRFYWAPVLERLSRNTGSNVQLVSVSGNVAEQEANRNVNLLIKGIAAGEQPRTAADVFRKTLQAAFKETYGDVTVLFDANSLEDQAETVVVDGKTLATVTFVIRVKFNLPAPGASPSPSASPKASR